MKRFFYTVLSVLALGMSQSSCESNNKPTAGDSPGTFDPNTCFVPNAMAMCTPECLEVIVDTHKISTQQSIVARAGITTIPYEISTPALKDSIGSRSCRDQWRIKLDTANHQVTFEIQDSANAPGYFSSALITGILYDRRTEPEEPVKFTFYESRDNNNSLHFIFDVTYPNTHVQFYNVSDLPTSHK